MNKYTHRLIYKPTPTSGQPGGLASEHTSRALAEKAMRRGITMSRGKLTEANFEIVEL